MPRNILEKEENTMKKYRLLLIHAIALMIMAVLTLKYANQILELRQMLKAVVTQGIEAAQTDESLPDGVEATQMDENLPDDVEPAVYNPDAWYHTPRILYHAGGAINGNTYTNSREAVEKSLAKEPGECFIEMDFGMTSDNVLVCVHNWSDVRIDQTEALSLREFQSSKIQGKYTPLTAEDFLQIMAQNEDLYLIADFKGTMEHLLPEMAEELIRLCGQDESLLKRVIIELHTETDKEKVLAMYPFADEQFIFSPYAIGGWSPEIASLCSRQNITVIATGRNEIPENQLTELRELGYEVYEFTVNRLDEARARMEQGICGFYTDHLTPEDLRLLSVE